MSLSHIKKKNWWQKHFNHISNMAMFSFLKETSIQKVWLAKSFYHNSNLLPYLPRHGSNSKCRQYSQLWIFSSLEGLKSVEFTCFFIEFVNLLLHNGNWLISYILINCKVEHYLPFIHICIPLELFLLEFKLFWNLRTLNNTSHFRIPEPHVVLKTLGNRDTRIELFLRVY